MTSTLFEAQTTCTVLLRCFITALTTRVFDNGISCVNSQTCCFMTVFAISTAPLLVLAQKAEEMAIQYRDKRQAAIFPYITCMHKMVSKVHLTNDFSAKEAGINLKLAECMQKTCINLNPQLHKNQSYALKCDFYWRLSLYFRQKLTCFGNSSVFRQMFCLLCTTVNIQHGRSSVVSAMYYTARQHTRYAHTPEGLYLQICNRVQCLHHLQKHRQSSVVPHDLLYFPLSKPLQAAAVQNG